MRSTAVILGEAQVLDLVLDLPGKAFVNEYKHVQRNKGNYV